MNGIVSYGAYVPKYRIKAEEIAQVWGKNPISIVGSLGVSEKSVAAYDEDAVTLGYEAAISALEKTKLDPQRIESIFVGSESHPYAVNPTSTIIGEFLKVGHNYLASDLEFACKAATTGLLITSALLDSGKIEYGLVVGTDCAQAKPHDALEYTAASAAAAFILGKKTKEIIAQIQDTVSYSSDTPDFWRRDGVSYPSHGGRFTGEPAYFTHVVNTGKILFQKTKTKPEDYDYCVFHTPNCKFPKDAALRLGFTREQLKYSLIVEKIGNSYSASSLLGLINVLDRAKPNQKIFFVSYGSGAGSDGIVFRTTKNILKVPKQSQLESLISDKEYISYVSYLKMRGVI